MRYGWNQVSHHELLVEQVCLPDIVILGYKGHSVPQGPFSHDSHNFEAKDVYTILFFQEIFYLVLQWSLKIFPRQPFTLTPTYICCFQSYFNLKNLSSGFWVLASMHKFYSDGYYLISLNVLKQYYVVFHWKSYELSCLKKKKKNSSFSSQLPLVMYRFNRLGSRLAGWIYWLDST